MALRKIHEDTCDTCMVRIYRDAEWQEFRVRLYLAGVLQKESDYFTDDKGDALGTSAIMLKRAVAHKQSKELFVQYGATHYMTQRDGVSIQMAYRQIEVPFNDGSSRLWWHYLSYANIWMGSALTDEGIARLVQINQE